MRGHLLLISAFTLLGGAIGLPAPAEPPVRKVVDEYCAGCHNAELKAGGLALDTIAAQNVTAHPQEWEKVVRKLRARYMPPAGVPRPDERTYEAVVAALEASLDAAAAATPNPGRTDTFRRLNRTEYQNAIRDLLHLDIDVASMLPEDESRHGFDAATGDLSPTLLERYLAVARKISRAAVGTPVRSAGGETILLPPDLTQEQHVEGLPFGTRGGTLLQHTFPSDGDYEFQVRLTRDRNEHVEGLTETHDVELLLDGDRVRVFTVKPPPTGDHSLVDKDLHARVPLKAGPHMVGVTFPQKTSVLLETERQPYQSHFNNDRHPRLQPAVYAVSIIGPYEARGPGDTPSRRRIFVCRPETPGEEQPCARRILSTLLRRAYRRPVSGEDLATPLKFFRDARVKGDFDSGIEMALRAVLVSPDFLFRIEQDPAGAAANSAYRVSDLELASRLSFFVWSSIPDDELLDVAVKRALHTPGVLRQQVRRMLADPRSRALVTNFAGQWLHLRNLAAASPDMRLFPDFDDNLRRALRQETELLFETIVREDRSVLDLLRADYTFVNERLAKHYGIPNVFGSRFRRVTCTGKPESGVAAVRGGLLRQGSILTVTSYANRTSPVIRGKWILTNILGVPPPPPLPAVPALKEKSAAGKVLSMRQRLALHRDNPPCSGCHQLMDPVGFSLENYDAVGRWRTREEAAAIDASGGLPDGNAFDGIDGLERALLARPELFATTFTEKLLTYGLARGVDYYDAPAVRKIVREARQNNFRFSSFIMGVATSTPFQMRRAQ